MFKIREYPELKDQPAIPQAVGQIRHIQRAIESDLSALPEDRKPQVDYEAFCQDPARFYAPPQRTPDRRGRKRTAGLNGPGFVPINQPVGVGGRIPG